MNKKCLVVFSVILVSHVAIAEPVVDSQTDNISPVAAENQTPQPMTEQTGFSKGRVARAVLTREVIDREPVDELSQISNDLSQISNDIEKIFFFTDLRDMAGHTVKHRWEHNGTIISEVEYNVRGPRWRIWSSKNMLPEWLGKWKVSVVNTVGDVIETREFEYVKAVSQSTQ